MNRRDMIALLGGAASWPVAARAQQPGMPVIGSLVAVSAAAFGDRMVEFRRGLGETGFVEGQNVVIEYRWAEGRYDRLPALAADLVQRQVTVIAAGGEPAALAAKAATRTIPIVFQSGFDPVEVGLVASLNRPGGNLTGFYRFANELVPKSLELLRQAVPRTAAIACLLNPTNSQAESQSRQVAAAARSLGQTIHVLNATTEAEIDSAFSAMIQQRANALVIVQDAFFNSRIGQFGALGFRYAVPTIYSLREFAAAGGLMSYGASLVDQFRQVGIYAGRILKGEKPGDLPVQQATKFELVVNMRTARAIGATVPPSLLAIADEVIE